MFVVTANRLLDGVPVYHGRDGSWTTDLNLVRLFEEKAAAAEVVELAKGQEALVCDPFSTKAEIKEGQLHFKGTKFRIRSQGPEVMLDSIGLTGNPAFQHSSHDG